MRVTCVCVWGVCAVCGSAGLASYDVCRSVRGISLLGMGRLVGGLVGCGVSDSRVCISRLFDDVGDVVVGWVGGLGCGFR